MGSFATRNEGTDSDLLTQQMAVAIAHGYQGTHERDATGFQPYDFFQYSFDPNGSHSGPSYGQQLNPSLGMQHLQYAPENSIPSMTAANDMRSHHLTQYVAQSLYLQSPGHLPLRDALSETNIESQESRNEDTMFSEPVVPPLDGFPDVKEFDQLMQR